MRKPGGSTPLAVVPANADAIVPKNNTTVRWIVLGIAFLPFSFRTREWFAAADFEIDSRLLDSG